MENEPKWYYNEALEHKHRKKKYRATERENESNIVGVGCLGAHRVYSNTICENNHLLGI